MCRYLYIQKWNCCQDLRLTELDEVLVGGPGWQASDVQVGLTQLLRRSLAAVVGAGAGRSHGMRGWSIGLLRREGKGRKDHVHDI